MGKKESTAKLSVISNTLLIIMKLVVGFVTGSVSIISEAIHSTMDLFAAIIAFFSVKYAEVPADEDHPYGHEKIENVSGVIEAILIFIASVFIILEAAKKIMHNEPVKELQWAILVMVVSSVVNFFVSKKLYKVAKEEDSVALEADALHLKVDIYTSMGVGIGLLIMMICKWIFGEHEWINYIDPVVAILIALFILKEAFDMLKTAFNPLIDAKLSDEDMEAIKSVVGQNEKEIIDFHDVRTRKSGKTKHIDFHLTVPKDMNVKKAHEICDKIEKDIEKKLKYTKVLIHIEPCECKCKECDVKSIYEFCKEDRK